MRWHSGYLPSNLSSILAVTAGRISGCSRDFVISFVLWLHIWFGYSFFVKFRPLKEGYFTMNSTTFMDWKLLIMMSNFGQRALAPFNFFFLGSVFAALYGAKIGKNSAVSVPLVNAFMVEIGDNSIVGAGTLICGNYLEKDKIFISPIKIGHNVTIGMNCVVLPNTVIGDGATLSIGSVVMPGTVIPAGETWKGNPARKWQ